MKPVFIVSPKLALSPHLNQFSHSPSASLIAAYEEIVEGVTFAGCPISQTSCAPGWWLGHIQNMINNTLVLHVTFMLLISYIINAGASSSYYGLVAASFLVVFQAATTCATLVQVVDIISQHIIAWDDSIQIFTRH